MSVKMETTSVVKQESGHILLSKDNEVFVMNYDIDEYLTEDEHSTVDSKHREQAPVAKEVTSEMEMEEQMLNVDIKEEELEVSHGKNKNKKTSSDKNNHGIKDNGYMKTSLKRNLKIADPERKVICAICGFKAMKKHHLSSHITLAHPKNKPPEKPTTFNCEYCMFSSNYKSSVTLHMSSFHMDKVLNTGSQTTRKKKSSYDVQSLKFEDHATLGDDKTYSCNYCSYTSPSNRLMRIHVPIHVIDKRPVKQCPHCPVRYTEMVLNVHIRKIHNPDGLFKCPKCNYVSKHKNNLRRHMRQNEKFEKCRLTIPRKNSLYSNEPKVKKKSHKKK